MNKDTSNALKPIWVAAASPPNKIIQAKEVKVLLMSLAIYLQSPHCPLGHGVVFPPSTYFLLYKNLAAGNGASNGMLLTGLSERNKRGPGPRNVGM